MLDRHRGVPRNRKREEDQQGRRDRPAAHAGAPAAEPGPRGNGHDDHGRQHDPDRSLDQKRSGRSGRGRNQPAVRGRMLLDAVRLDAQSDDRPPGGKRDEEGERQIGQRMASHGDIAEAGGCNQAGEQRRPVVVPAAGAGAGKQREADPRQRGGDPRRGGGDAGQRVGHRRQPVVQDRFLEPDLTVVVGSEPVAAVDHLAGSLCIVRLVRIGHGGAPEAGEERQRADARDHGRMT